jgi:hypothetical protein
LGGAKKVRGIDFDRPPIADQISYPVADSAGLAATKGGQRAIIPTTHQPIDMVLRLGVGDDIDVLGHSSRTM